MTRILVFFIVAIAVFAAGAYFGQTDVGFVDHSEQIRLLQDQNELLRVENATLRSQVELIREALQTNIAAMVRIQRNPGDAASSAGELRLIIEDQRELLDQSQTE